MVQLVSLKSRKVTLPVTVPKPRKLAVSRTGVPTGPPGDAVARTWAERLATMMVKVWHAGACTPLLAHTVVGPKVPACVGAPATMPPGDMVIPGGREPLVTENVTGSRKVGRELVGVGGPDDRAPRRRGGDGRCRLTDGHRARAERTAAS